MTPTAVREKSGTAINTVPSTQRIKDMTIYPIFAALMGATERMAILLSLFHFLLTQKVYYEPPFFKIGKKGTVT